MTIEIILERVSTEHPHSYDPETLLNWINDLERDIAEVYTHYKGTEDYIFENHEGVDEDIQVDEPRIYVPYVIAQICLANEEYDRFNNYSAIFEAAYQDWKDKYIREHAPVYRGKVQI